ncbi:PPE domain-containing protein [Amycolatopsis sp. H20-H5]|uniref:PPE domain-containing protein n=1 Tax=Amycolatopsis sp. H20-H5 TaxID=3046309 RepID=UPI002DBE69BA|nr:PPE domain-containing protein [Amycolatopsis sp. H20-H5]MEC3978869.1 PPE domain-containing protein [Amycolatopsis sp. H20-H5]
MIALPPVEPEPGPEHLAESIDWLTYSHQELYDMVNTGLDLTQATRVAARWAKLGEALDEIGAELSRAVTASADGWEGAGADKARDAATRLVAWANDAGRRATEVSGCVSRQADNAETARLTMPEPPRVPVHAVPASKAVPADSTAAMSASAFTGGDFASAGAMMIDPGPQRLRAQELHHQAADVMRRLQRDSSEVFGTVPEFTPPGDSLGKKKDQPKPRPPADSTTKASADVPGPKVLAPIETPREPLGQGPAAGAGTLGTEGRPGVAQVQPGSAAAGQRPGGMGAMPMGGASGARREEDAERVTPGYLVEESDIWARGGPVTPPVIGEEPRRGGY